MAPLTNLLALPLLLLATLCPTPSMCYVSPAVARAQQDSTKTSTYRTYIVLVEPPPLNAKEEAYRRWYQSFLPSLHIADSVEPRLLHSYSEAFSGFAARLTDDELGAVAKKPGFVRAFPSRTLQLTTMRTPEFLGLREGTGFWSDAGYGKGVIVGVLDTGIYAAHPSFDDHGIPPPPAKWKGSCKTVRCNNKLTGAKTVIGGDSGDPDGHGTHTSSTAAGNFVTGASYNGLAAGTAAGISPSAHIAMHKVCSPSGCEGADIVAGIDVAIKDGVVVLSISISGNPGDHFDQDAVAIGAFTAVSKGIIVVSSAGNRGPFPRSVANDPPWLLTVAAGSVDRSFYAEVLLGNGRRIGGETLTQVGKPSSKPYPLFYPADRRFCENMDSASVVGKVVICVSLAAAFQDVNIRCIMVYGAAGMVLFNTKSRGYTVDLMDYNSSVIQVAAADGVVLTDHAMSAASSAIDIFTYSNTLLGVRPAPAVASFSSRGPNHVAPGVLKPDILVPGLNILGAFPPNTDNGMGPFSIMSGTSTETPHVSGVAALIKILHPDWSPAAIKSAILTTSDAVNRTGGPILNEKYGKSGAYDRGAGHVNPARAADPGLVYDLGITDYASFICSLLGQDGLATIAMRSYPRTITVRLTKSPFTVKRTVTNVGPAASTYKAKVDVPNSLRVRVSPDTLVFCRAGEKKTFSVSVSCHDAARHKLVGGSLSWVSEEHVVRSPIVASLAS
uniref:Uncharacterized protein n=1 Tax=Avena sativa TaxID=4498 RepID=A0ACD5WMC1_AVESA